MRETCLDLDKDVAGSKRGQRYLDYFPRLWLRITSQIEAG